MRRKVFRAKLAVRLSQKRKLVPLIGDRTKPRLVDFDARGNYGIVHPGSNWAGRGSSPGGPCAVRCKTPESSAARAGGRKSCDNESIASTDDPPRDDTGRDRSRHSNTPFDDSAVFGFDNLSTVVIAR
jgi:hypothetical protein